MGSSVPGSRAPRLRPWRSEELRCLEQHNLEQNSRMERPG